MFGGRAQHGAGRLCESGKHKSLQRNGRLGKTARWQGRYEGAVAHGEKHGKKNISGNYAPETDRRDSRKKGGDVITLHAEVIIFFNFFPQHLHFILLQVCALWELMIAWLEEASWKIISSTGIFNVNNGWIVCPVFLWLAHTPHPSD